MKRIVFKYHGSFVKTTLASAYTILGIGSFISLFLVVIILTENKYELMLTALYIFLSCFVSFLLLISLSKILQHLLYLRACSVASAVDAGYTIRDEELTNEAYQIITHAD